MEKDKQTDKQTENIDQITKEIAAQLYKVPRREIVFGDTAGGEAVNALRSSNWECVDGRVKEEGKLRYPGGSLGLFMTLLATMDEIGKSVDVQALKKRFETVMGQIHYHTDEHAKEEHFVCAGCGHMRLISENPRIYKVNSTWLEELGLNNQVPQKDIDSGVCTVLAGGHEEKAVFVLRGTEQARLPSSKLGKHSVFVYHKDVAEQTLVYLLEAFKGAKLTNTELDALRQIIELQVSNTVTQLAKGLPQLEF